MGFLLLRRKVLFWKIDIGLYRGNGSQKPLLKGMQLPPKRTPKLIIRRLNGFITTGLDQLHNRFRLGQIHPSV